MALVRILVDGYSLLHGWREIAPKQARFSAAARSALIDLLGRYSDACGIPITVVFDGNDSRSAKKDSTTSSRHIEVLYSRAGQTADQIIERVAHRMKPYGEVLVITDDFAERDTVISLGGLAASCQTFVGQVETALADLKSDVARYNSRERRRYTRT